MNSSVVHIIIIMVCSILWSTALYLFLHFKTKIRFRYLFIDNPAVAITSSMISYALFIWSSIPLVIVLLVSSPVSVLFLASLLTMIHFWKVPKRKILAGPGQVVSPADGNIIYIRKVEEGEIIYSKKGSNYSKLEELTKTSLLSFPGWHIGINMTLFDVHKNCAPVSGKIILNQHFNGKFLSLKSKASQTDNERNTYVMQNDEITIGVVQIASKRVRRIDTYVKQGDNVRQGEWIGMIRFGSQVDIIFPASYNIRVRLGEQVYAVETIIAEKNENTD
jgi:phosphatidylserine decarboxylase